MIARLSGGSWMRVRRYWSEPFPLPDIKTFIAPYDRLSPVALEELIARGFHISTMSPNLAPLPELPQVTGFGAGTIGTGQMLYVCDDYLFSL